MQWLNQTAQQHYHEPSGVIVPFKESAAWDCLAQGVDGPRDASDRAVYAESDASELSMSTPRRGHRAGWRCGGAGGSLCSRGTLWSPKSEKQIQTLFYSEI